MVSKVLGTWYLRYWVRHFAFGVPGFESTGYMVSEVSGYGVYSFSLTLAIYE